MVAASRNNQAGVIKYAPSQTRQQDSERILVVAFRLLSRLVESEDCGLGPELKIGGAIELGDIVKHVNSAAEVVEHRARHRSLVVGLGMFIIACSRPTP
jgi:hypothetical protein